jgi:hypothetical protein
MSKFLQSDAGKLNNLLYFTIKKINSISFNFSRHFFPPRKSNYSSSTESKLFDKLLDGNQCKLMKKYFKLKFMNSIENLLINQLNEQQFKNWLKKKCNLYVRDLCNFPSLLKLLIFWNLWIQLKKFWWKLNLVCNSRTFLNKNFLKFLIDFPPDFFIKIISICIDWEAKNPKLGKLSAN